MTSKIEIIISRFNEDLKWTTRGIFNNYRYIVYNKGDNDDFEKTNVDKIIYLKNVGKCDHTYLYHIIQNYNNLPDILLFLPGSLDLLNKNTRATEILEMIKNTRNAVFLGEYYENIKNKFENFCLNNWKATNNQNFSKNNESILDLSVIRPFGKWYQHNFDNIIVNYVCYWGIFSLDKRDIIQHPINRYINLINQLNTSSNPEVGHYIERSWAAIFHPMNYTKLILKKY
jgi:hypothetical protein